MKIAVLFERLGPYHFARLKAANELCQLHAIEFFSVDDTYAWDVVSEKAGFSRTTLFTDSGVEKKSTFKILEALKNAFAFIEPEVVAIPGWSGRPAFSALALCRKMRIPAIAMSASTEQDQVRHWWKELIKKRVTGSFSAALVGGRPQADYMYKLGMPSGRIFHGYDVVDNDYFSKGALRARENSALLRGRYNLPENYFLGSHRFIDKKNIDRLIRAYAGYRAHAGSGAWKLVLLGDGELRLRIEGLIAKLGIDEDVILPGFKQYADLPVYYGLAKAYVQASTTEQWGLVVNEAMASGLPVLVSSRCGCATDLVREGLNGFTFNPYEVNQITGRLIKISSSDVDLTAMGRASRDIISEWTPETFAENLILAAKAALSAPQKRFALSDKFILQALGHR
jgi:glycosyltransferase involved in cell wall biosynthesis